MGHKTRFLVNGIVDKWDDRIGWMNGEFHERMDGCLNEWMGWKEWMDGT